MGSLADEQEPPWLAEEPFTTNGPPLPAFAEEHRRHPRRGHPVPGVRVEVVAAHPRTAASPRTRLTGSHLYAGEPVTNAFSVTAVTRASSAPTTALAYLHGNWATTA